MLFISYIDYKSQYKPYHLSSSVFLRSQALPLALSSFQKVLLCFLKCFHHSGGFANLPLLAIISFPLLIQIPLVTPRSCHVLSFPR